MSLRSNAVAARLVLALAVGLALSGCQKKEEQAATDAATPAATTAAEVLEGQVDIVAWPG